MAADHNPHTLLGNSSVAQTVLHFAPKNVKFLLLTCHPAKRALATYRFRYFGKGEFAFRKQALLDLEAQGMDFGANAVYDQHTFSLLRSALRLATAKN